MRNPRRSPREFAVICLAAALLVVALGSLPVGSALMRRLEGLAGDTLLQHSRLPPPGDAIVFLGIDEATLAGDLFDDQEAAANPVLAEMRRGFPWSRTVLAAAVRRLCEAGAALVIIDLLLPERAADPDGDADLAFALEDFAGRVVIGSGFARRDDGTATLMLPGASVLERTGPADPRVGFVNFWPDPDGVVRRADFRMTLSEYAGQAPRPGEPEEQSMVAAALRQLGRPDLVPAAPEGRRIAFRRPGADGTNPIPTRPFCEIFIPGLWEKNFAAGRALQGKIVCIGPAASALQDFHPTPLGQMMGPQLHLTTLDAALHGDFLRETGPLAQLAALAGAAALAWLAVTLAPGPASALGILLALAPAWLGGAGLALSGARLPVPVAAPLLTLLLGGLGSLGWDFARTLVQKNRLGRTLARYVSRNVAAAIVEHPDKYYATLGGTRQQVTILFSDLRGFTAMTEGRDAADVVAQLNRYLGRMVAAVFAHGGTLDKFMGDAVMAVWGNLDSRGAREDTLAAVAAALAMQESLAALNSEWAAENLPPLAMGVGLHHGPAIVGNIGSEERMEPTVIGDAVNLGSRLEGLSKVYGAAILASGEVAALAAHAFPARLLDRVKVKGRQAAVEVWEFFAGEHARAGCAAGAADYTAGLAACRAGDFAAAAAQFARCQEKSPADRAAAAMAARCRELAADPPADWDGAYPMTSK
jgi:adenylate cyclase